MANSEHVALLKKGVGQWNEWWRSHPAIMPDFRTIQLRGANLRGADFHRAHFTDADLRDTDLHGADLSGAHLRGCDLRGARLNDTDLRDANLLGARLVGANLHKAHLRATDLTRADLREADLSGAILWNTVFADTNLGEAKGLDYCQHIGPSSVGIDTLFRAKGEIPERFLLGCGISERFITYARSIVLQPIEFYSCFISYSSHDQAFAERLHADLRAKDLRCWFAPEDLEIGDRFQERIEESILVFDKVMIVLSEASVQSRWVEREVNAAREREDRDKRTILFLIRIDDAVMNAPQPWAADIRRTRNIGDFRTWEDHSFYRKAFDRLLRDLKAKGDASARPA